MSDMNIKTSGMFSDFTAAPDPVNYEDGLPSVDQIFGRLYPSSDVLGVDVEVFSRDVDQDDMGAGYNIADQNSNPNTVPGIAAGRDVDPDDL